MGQVDILTVLVVLAGVGLAVALAILAGTVTARVFFDASKGHLDAPVAHKDDRSR